MPYNQSYSGLNPYSSLQDIVSPTPYQLYGEGHLNLPAYNNNIVDYVQGKVLGPQGGSPGYGQFIQDLLGYHDTVNPAGGTNVADYPVPLNQYGATRAPTGPTYAGTATNGGWSTADYYNRQQQSRQATNSWQPPPPQQRQPTPPQQNYSPRRMGRMDPMIMMNFLSSLVQNPRGFGGPQMRGPRY